MQPLRPALTYVYVYVHVCECVQSRGQRGSAGRLVCICNNINSHRKQADYCLHLHLTPLFLPSSYYSENVLCDKMPCVYQRLQL